MSRFDVPEFMLAVGSAAERKGLPCTLTLHEVKAMTLKDFAEANRLRLRNDGCGDPIIPGKFGHLYAHSTLQMGVCLEHPAKSKLGVRAMRFKLRKLTALLGVPRQEGDTEGLWLLPIGCSLQTPGISAALRTVGIRKIGKPRGRTFEPKASI
jgi:hypothetical protein